MNITVRPYKREEDYDLIGDFLIETYNGEKYNNWLQPRWEYMHYHPYLYEGGGYNELNRIGIWEDSGKIVGIVHFEHSLGEVFFEVHPNYSHLKAEMLEYAEKNLYGKTDDGRLLIKAFINDFDNELIAITEAKGYVKDESYPQFRTITKFTITDPFPEIKLPEGFKLKSLTEDNNLEKINRVLWRGFNHPGEAPEKEVEGRKLMQSAPNFNKDITIVVEAPNGEFVSFCGMWYDADNKIAYVEPVATDPEYRRMGLGKAVVLEGVRRCGDLGATIAIVESGQEFYYGIGFEKVFTRFPWVKYIETK